MGAGLKDFVAESTSTGAPLRMPAKGVRMPKSNFISVFLVPKNLLPDIGSVTTFTPPTGSAAAITTSNIVSVLTILALNGMAWSFPNGTIQGKRGKFKADEEAVIFGSQRTKHDTGEGELAYSFMTKYGYMNTVFMNQLRLEFTDYDIYAFTDRSVEVIRFDLVEPVFKNVSNGEVTGNNSDSITNGGFDIIVGSDGDIEPEFGLFEKALSSANFKYSFGVPAVSGTGIVSTLSGTVITKTSGGSGTITNAVLETLATGTVAYSLLVEGGGALPANITVDGVSGVVTIAAGLTAGTYKFIVAAENKTGIMGQYNFKLIAA